MYRVTLILFGILAVETFLEELLVGFGFASERSMTSLGRVVNLGVSILCGAYGKAWYFGHTTRMITRIRNLGLNDDAHFEALARRGGTSLLGSLGVFLLAVLAFVVIEAVANLVLPSE
jgi:hypothetical protein